MGENKDVFVFAEKKTIVRIYSEDIVFVESDGHYNVIYTKDGQSHRTRSTMTSFFEKVGTDAVKRVHRAFAVNLSFVHKVKGGKIYLQTKGQTVPLSRTYKEDFLEEFMSFKGRKALSGL